MKLLELADLYCGGGGTTHGAHVAVHESGRKARHTLVNHCKKAMATQALNHPAARRLCTGVNDVDPTKLYLKTKLDHLWASPECIFHSVARGGKPIDDQRRASAWCVVRWAEALQPPIIQCENVPEFVNWGPTMKVFRWVKEKDKRTGKKVMVRRKVEVPDPRYKGKTFIAWVEALRSLGYKVDWRVMCAADYGDPTTRERLIVYAVRGRLKVVWPNPTHAPADKIAQLQGQARDFFQQPLQPYRNARDHVIDWSDLGVSIFNRKAHRLSPHLVQNTLRRILAGIEKEGLAPFMLSQASGGAPRNVKDPVPTICTSGKVSLTQPLLLKLRGTSKQQITGSSKSVDGPVPTVTAGGGHLAISQPCLVKFHGNHAGKQDGAQRIHSVDNPVPTVDTSNRLGVMNPVLIPFRSERDGQTPRTHSVDEPIPVVACGHNPGLSSPFVMQVNHGGGDDRRVSSVDDPLHTVTTKNGTAVVNPFIIGAGGPERAGEPQSTSGPIKTVLCRNTKALVSPFIIGTDHTGGNGKVGRTVDEPITTITSKARHGLCVPFVVKYYGHSASQPVEQPLDTCTTKPRFGLCRAVLKLKEDEPEQELATCILESGRCFVTTRKIAQYFAKRVKGVRWSLDLPDNFTEILVDLLFRMLGWRELARAQGFPDSYQFHGNDAQKVKQIGNAVPCGLARALIKAAITQCPDV